jgi:hypothetical protein
MDRAEQALNRAGRRRQGRYASAGHGRRYRAEVVALNEELRTTLRPR